MSEHGFSPEANALDSARLRAVTDHGHENPLAAAAYTAHRDTWYANPQAQINWWIPLFDVSEGETFAFFPLYFDKPVANDSAAFDYDKWSEQVGFQSTSASSSVPPAVYPASNGKVYSQRHGAVCSQGRRDHSLRGVAPASDLQERQRRNALERGLSHCSHRRPRGRIWARPMSTTSRPVALSMTITRRKACCCHDACAHLSFSISH
jgi:hypothetical protein